MCFIEFQIDKVPRCRAVAFVLWHKAASRSLFQSSQQTGSWLIWIRSLAILGMIAPLDHGDRKPIHVQSVSSCRLCLVSCCVLMTGMVGACGHCHARCGTQCPAAVRAVSAPRPKEFSCSCRGLFQPWATCVQTLWFSLLGVP